MAKKKTNKEIVDLDLNAFTSKTRTVKIFDDVYTLGRIPTRLRLEFKKLLNETSTYYDNPDDELAALEQLQAMCKKIIPTLPDDVVEMLDYTEIQNLFIDLELEYIKARFGPEAYEAAKKEMTEALQSPEKMKELTEKARQKQSQTTE